MSLPPGHAFGEDGKPVLTVMPEIYGHAEDAPGPISASEADESLFSILEFLDSLPPDKCAIRVRAFLRLAGFDKRPLRESAALAGCALTTFFRETRRVKQIFRAGSAG
jgi:hypothetical protein